MRRQALTARSQELPTGRQELTARRKELPTSRQVLRARLAELETRRPRESAGVGQYRRHRSRRAVEPLLTFELESCHARGQRLIRELGIHRGKR